MTAESTFRALAIANIALCMPIGFYFRIRSQATKERLARREEDLVVMVGLRPCGVLAWILFAAYPINPAWMSWSSLTLPDWLRWAGAILGLLTGPPSCSGVSIAWARTSPTRSSPGVNTSWSPAVPTDGCATHSISSSSCGCSRSAC